MRNEMNKEMAMSCFQTKKSDHEAAVNPRLTGTFTILIISHCSGSFELKKWKRRKVKLFWNRLNPTLITQQPIRIEDDFPFALYKQLIKNSEQMRFVLILVENERFTDRESYSWAKERDHWIELSWREGLVAAQNRISLHDWQPEGKHMKIEPDLLCHAGDNWTVDYKQRVHHLLHGQYLSFRTLLVIEIMKENSCRELNTSSLPSFSTFTTILMSIWNVQEMWD